MGAVSTRLGETETYQVLLISSPYILINAVEDSWYFCEQGVSDLWWTCMFFSVGNAFERPSHAFVAVHETFDSPFMLHRNDQRPLAGQCMLFVTAYTSPWVFDAFML